MEVCMAAVLVGVMQLLGCAFDSSWCLVCELCRLTLVWVDSRFFLSSVFLCGAKRVELSPYNTLEVHIETTSLSAGGGPVKYVQLSEGGFQVVYPLGVWSRLSGFVKVLYGYG